MLSFSRKSARVPGIQYGVALGVPVRWGESSSPRGNRLKCSPESTSTILEFAYSTWVPGETDEVALALRPGGSPIRGRASTAGQSTRFITW